MIAGVGEKRQSHAERIANTALGLLIASRDVISPLDGDHIQVHAVFFYDYLSPLVKRSAAVSLC